MSETTAIEKKEAPGALANYEERLAQEARDEAAKERITAPSMSCYGGKITIAGQPVEGPSVQAVILASTFMKTLYRTDYDPDEIAPPSCWAIAEKEEDLICSPQGWEQIHPDGCAKCPANQWKSDDRQKGKACSDQRKVALIAGNDLNSPEATIYTLKVSPTGLPIWKRFVNSAKDTFNRPPHGILAELSPLAVKTWHVWSFKPVGIVPPEALANIYKKRDQALEMLTKGWDKPTEDPAAKLQAKQNAPRKF